MSSCDKTYTITEYGRFARGVDFPDYKRLPDETFDALEAFILVNNTGKGTDANELLSISTRRGVGKIITARNYVGLITMTDGTVIEILPKIAGDDDDSKGRTRQVFIEMLKTLKDVIFKDFIVSHLRTARLNLFEIFIKMFLDEVGILTKQGLKAAYTPIESNERFYKGKLLTSQDIKYNLVRKEHFFVRYDDFNINRPENRLIKSTLNFLLKASGNACNRLSAIKLLSFFDSVEYSKNYDADFSKCFIDRSTNYYDKAISWCKVFLRGNSFTAFAGSEVALALLFPMEKVFESFVASKIRKCLGCKIKLHTQDSRYSLFDHPTPAFALRPDIVLEFDELTVVMDTKWKLLSDNAQNNGISQSDMYQMYAYSKKYKAKNIFLIYPYSNAMSKTEIKYASDDDVKVEVAFIDLLNANKSINNLVKTVTDSLCKS
jgi:5-methylcytosine-specific restriction enzyme subunit McrC